MGNEANKPSDGEIHVLVYYKALANGLRWSICKGKGTEVNV